METFVKAAIKKVMETKVFSRVLVAFIFPSCMSKVVIGMGGQKPKGQVFPSNVTTSIHTT